MDRVYVNPTKFSLSLINKNDVGKQKWAPRSKNRMECLWENFFVEDVCYHPRDSEFYLLHGYIILNVEPDNR